MKTLSLLLLCISFVFLSSASLITNPTNLTARSPPQIPTNERRGIAYNNAKLLSLFAQPGSHITWRYNWDSSTASSPTTFDFTPMLHSVRSDHTKVWKTNVEAIVEKNWEKGRATWVLGFNEPDNCIPNTGGSCIDIATTVAAWKQYLQPLAASNRNVYLGSPAVTNARATDTSGLGWLARFLRECTGCSVDFVNIHWYGVANVHSFKAHIDATRKVAQGRPIWITEFKPEGTVEQIRRFLEEVMPWMDESPDVHRYAYFMATPGEGFLVDGNGGALSEIGRTFAFFHRH
ncbi:glycoside hydrolase family 128 protein [Bipolaris victoriae FI3]|uniref:Glycoside hydrolase family 128 protein n=1 Tax=Bipolaris victoriae (strain FI3) TaxID=930091 RepID=W7DYQ4_BIPV3|nr:glycoside hydrolase family 128 protein [Bipolaris victoriae FI3]